MESIQPPFRTFEDFEQLPLIGKDNYLYATRLRSCASRQPARLRYVGRFVGIDRPANHLPRSAATNFIAAARAGLLRQLSSDDTDPGRRVLRARTWVGGMYTASCCRHLAARGYPITVVTRDNLAEILRVSSDSDLNFEQIVLLGYPPFSRTSWTLDWPTVWTGRATGQSW